MGTSVYQFKNFSLLSGLESKQERNKLLLELCVIPDGLLVGLFVPVKIER